MDMLLLMKSHLKIWRTARQFLTMLNHQLQNFLIAILKQAYVIGKLKNPFGSGRGNTFLQYQALIRFVPPFPVNNFGL